MPGPPPSTPPRGPRVLEESDYGGAAASGASGQTGPLIGQVGALRATGSRSSYSPPRHRVACIRMTVGYGKSRFTRARRKQTLYEEFAELFPDAFPWGYAFCGYTEPSIKQQL